MQASGKRACSYLPECRLSYTKIMQVERNGKSGKRSFTRLDTAEMPLILYLYKDKNFIDKRGHIVVERILINLFLRSVSIKC